MDAEQLSRVAPSIFTQPSYYRANARDLRERAKREADGERRSSYLSLATEYEQYAGELEERSRGEPVNLWTRV